MKKYIPLVLLLIAKSVSADAEDGIKPSVNYCHDQERANKNQALLEKSQHDEMIIKLVALRVGLCGLVDTGKIELQQAIDIFEHERSKAIVEREHDNLQIKPDIES